MSPDSSASPSLRLPGWLHYREGFIPLTVAATGPPPVKRMLPWSTCGDTQGLVRIAPAKQYRMQLHVTTNDKAERCGRPVVSSSGRDAARPHSLQCPCWQFSLVIGQACEIRELCARAIVDHSVPFVLHSRLPGPCQFLIEL